jgi:hypothetical protein
MQADAPDGERKGFSPVAAKSNELARQSSHRDDAITTLPMRHDDEQDETMTDITTSDLAQCAENVRVGWGLMLAAEGQIAEGKAQWIEGVLKAAEAIVTARDAMKNDAEFGKWCSDNGLSLKVIDKDNRAALIRCGRNLAYWRARLAAEDSKIGQSLRYLIKDVPDEEVSLAAIPARHQTKPGPKPKPETPSWMPSPGPPPIDRGDPNRVWPVLTQAHADEIGKRLRARFGPPGGVINIGDWNDSRAIERLRDNPFEALEADRSLEGLFEAVEAKRRKEEDKAADLAEYNRLVEEGRKIIAATKDATAQPTRSAPVRTPPSAKPDEDDEVEVDHGYPYDPDDPLDTGELSENLWQAIKRAGLGANQNDTKITIFDRDDAVVWFEEALAAYDKAHPDHPGAGICICGGELPHDPEPDPQPEPPPRCRDACAGPRLALHLSAMCDLEERDDLPARPLRKMRRRHQLRRCVSRPQRGAWRQEAWRLEARPSSLVMWRMRLWLRSAAGLSLLHCVPLASPPRPAAYRPQAA